MGCTPSKNANTEEILMKIDENILPGIVIRDDSSMGSWRAAMMKVLSRIMQTDTGKAFLHAAAMREEGCYVIIVAPAHAAVEDTTYPICVPESAGSAPTDVTVVVPLHLMPEAEATTGEEDVAWVEGVPNRSPTPSFLYLLVAVELLRAHHHVMGSTLAQNPLIRFPGSYSDADTANIIVGLGVSCEVVVGGKCFRFTENSLRRENKLPARMSSLLAQEPCQLQAVKEVEHEALQAVHDAQLFEAAREASEISAALEEANRFETDGSTRACPLTWEGMNPVAATGSFLQHQMASTYRSITSANPTLDEAPEVDIVTQAEIERVERVAAARAMLPNVSGNQPVQAEAARSIPAAGMQPAPPPPPPPPA